MGQQQPAFDRQSTVGRADSNPQPTDDRIPLVERPLQPLKRLVRRQQRLVLVRAVCWRSWPLSESISVDVETDSPFQGAPSARVASPSAGPRAHRHHRRRSGANSRYRHGPARVPTGSEAGALTAQIDTCRGQNDRRRGKCKNKKSTVPDRARSIRRRYASAHDPFISTHQSGRRRRSPGIPARDHPGTDVQRTD